MGTKKTPAPKRAGTATKTQAEKFARSIVRELDGNPEALRIVQQVISMLASASRRRNRRRRD